MPQTVLITGASSGLGFAFAKFYAKHQYRLILVARNGEKLTKIKELLNTEVEIFACNLAKENEILALCNHLIEQNDIPDILINNAGIGGIYPFDEASFAEEKQMIDLNITAIVCLCNHFAPYMKKKQTSTYILNIASSAAFVPGAYQANYYATKAYILSYSQAIAAECKGSSLSVSCYCPGRISSNFHAAAGTKYEHKAMPPATAALYAHNAMMKKKIVKISPFKMFIMAGILPRFLPSSWVSIYTKDKNSQLLKIKYDQQKNS